MSTNFTTRAGATFLAPRYEKGKATGAFPFYFGAAEESRTLDLNLGKVALYQLSYCRLVFGGAGRSRTDLHGFAIRCITALLPRRLQSNFALLLTTETSYACPENLERQKSLELSTSTLARLRSTN